MTTLTSEQCCLLVGIVIYICINVLVFGLVIAGAYRVIKEFYNTSKEKRQTYLFSVVIAFNLVTIATIIGLTLMAVLKFESILDGADLNQNAIYSGYHSIFVLFYGKQNCLMLLILYLRLYHIFLKTTLKLSQRTIIFFNICFMIALTLFTSLPILHSQYLYISIWTFCASSFCFFNITFMILLSCLFLYKLTMVFKSVKYSNPESKVKSVITKTFILAVCVVLSVFLMEAAVLNRYKKIYIKIYRCYQFR